MAKESLYNRLCQYSTLHSAWKTIKSKGAAGGIDGITVSEADDSIDQILSELHNELNTQTWMPLPYLRITIPKKNNERRKLGLLTIKDKIVQQALKSLIEPRFEKLFVKNSYGYRPSKGHTKAVRYALHCFKNKMFQCVLRLDIDNYFDNVDHEILNKRLCALISDAEIDRLIMLSMKMGCVDNHSRWETVSKGLPQGGVLSPLLANLYLHSFDQFVLSKDVEYVRYADDFLIFCKTRSDADNLLTTAQTFLNERLHLNLNTPLITNVSENIEFLGIQMSNSGLSLSISKENSLRDKILQLSWEKNHFSEKGLRTIQGIKQYYAAVLPEKYLERLDNLVIERVKDIITTQWQSIPSKTDLKNALRKIDLFYLPNIKQIVKLRDEFIQQYSALKQEKQRTLNEKKNANIIKKRKNEYRKIENEATELIVCSFGAYIGINKGGISVKNSGKQTPLPTSNNLQHIVVIGKGVSISSNALEFCMERNIPIDYFSASGKHIASVLSASFLDNCLWQSQSSMDISKRCDLATKIISAKMRNQLNLIKYFHKYHKSTSNSLCNVFDRNIPLIKNLIVKVSNYKPTPNSNYKSDIMACEAECAQLYWSYVEELLRDDDVGFVKREHRGATDLVNCMLNFGYTMLYSRVWQAVLFNKLNPYDGVLHARQPHKPTFVFDVVELFRTQAVDRVVISLIQKGEPLIIEKGLLDSKSVALLSHNLTERLNRYEQYRGKECRLCDIIKIQTKAIASFIESNSLYKPYIAKW
jgi:group II intron reverse transcriptase/maturase/CRISPR-associated endonuclease Cas1